VLVCAEEAAGTQLLRSLGRRPEHRVAAVLTRPEATTAQATIAATVATVARQMNLRLLPSRLVEDAAFADWVLREEIDILLNVHSLHIVHADVVRAPRIGSFNLHPGPLPRYAGLNAPSWAVYNGERTHGVTVHWMEPEIDTGPIAYQSMFDLAEDDNGVSVSARCVKLGLPLVLGLLDGAASDPGSIPAVRQDLSLRSYFGARPPYDCRLRWSWTAAKIERFVRACDYFPLESPWGHPIARLGTSELGLARVAFTGEHCREEPGALRRDGAGAIQAATGDEWIRLVRLYVEGEHVEPTRVLADVDALQDG
jgi:methionyl-tRNA formyltransferase